MPVLKCNNGKWRIGSGECKHETKEKAEEVWKAILASGQYGKININGKDKRTNEGNIRETEGRQGSEEQKQKQS
jgi:hypothetical protein